jgi:hypothetical protein
MSFMFSTRDLIEMGDPDGGGLKEMDEKLKTYVQCSLESCNLFSRIDKLTAFDVFDVVLLCQLSEENLRYSGAKHNDDLPDGQRIILTRIAEHQQDRENARSKKHCALPSGSPISIKSSRVSINSLPSTYLM